MPTGKLAFNMLLATATFLCSLSNITAQSTDTSDSITIVIEPQYNDVNSFHKFWLGESYRKLWATPVKLKLFHLKEEKGGLTILQKGGGLQTKSLRLRDATGQEWVLRTIQKYPENGLPEHLRATVVKDILQDQVSTAHPFGSLTVPVFANALGIAHSNPQIVYVPADTALGVYMNDFGNAAFLFEEREPIGENTDNTLKLKQQLKKDNDNAVDQKLVLRARLLDMLLGDWDRHEDQWRWQKNKVHNGIMYTPVPRDRDQVFYNTSGVFPWVVSHQWLMSKFQGFHKRIRDITGFNFNARYFDRYFLNSLDEADWRDAINYVQNKITDSVINTAIHKLPDTIFVLSGEKLIENLKSRRSALLEEGMQYYKFIAKTVEVPASDKRELFDINYTSEGNADITVYKTKKDGTKDNVIYHRVFIKGVTHEVRLYGFDGKDAFSVTGGNSNDIKIRVVGGEGKDSFYIAPNIRNKRNLFVYDNIDKSNKLPSRRQVKIRVSKDSTVNDYNDQSFKYDRSGPLVLANYNIDQGLLLKVGFLSEKQGFRKDPYARKQQMMANYATARRSYSFDYTGDFKGVIKKNDLNINVIAKGPNNTGNFFGIGNESEFINRGNKKIGYYRNRYDIINADVSLKHYLSKYTAVYAGMAGQYYTATSRRNDDRFLNKYDTLNPQQNVFGNKWYGGLIAGLVVDSRNDAVLPNKGFLWNVLLTGMTALNGESKSYGKLTADFSWYAGTGKKNNLVIANRVGTGTTVGKPAFFQMLGLGGAQIMRGFHTNRFIGKTILYHNLELRLKLFDFNSYLIPGTLGLIGFNDVGRVWVPGENSKQWHDAYGGGIYLIPARLVLIQAVAGVSKDGVLPYITIGFRF
ncbi:hypothetical protein BH11BAC3_BH11BAC3_33110 [soil metagenome]